MKNSILIALSLVLAVAVVSSCSRNSAPSDCADSAIAEPLDSLFSAMFPRNEPGAIVGVAVDGEPVYLHGFGKARLDTDKP